MDEIIQRLERLERLLCNNTVYLKEILSVEEACFYMGLSESTIYKLTSKEEIPFFKPNGKKIFFKREDLNAWLLRNRYSSVEELQEQAHNFLLNQGGKNDE